MPLSESEIDRMPKNVSAQEADKALGKRIKKLITKLEPKNLFDKKRTESLEAVIRSFERGDKIIDFHILVKYVRYLEKKNGITHNKTRFGSNRSEDDGIQKSVGDSGAVQSDDDSG